MENVGVFCGISCLSFVNFEQIWALIQTLNHLAKQAKCCEYLSVWCNRLCFYHVTYVF